MPVIFFLLAKAIFDDHFKPTALIAVWFGIEIPIHFWVYLRDIMVIPTWTLQASYILAEVVSIGFFFGGNLYGNQNPKR